MILYWYFATFLAIVAGSLFLPPAEPLASYSLGSPQPYIYMAVCTLAFAIGYFALHILPQPGAPVVAPSPSPRFLQTRYLFLLLIITISGLVILLLQIQATVGLARYLVLLAANEVSGSTVDIRQSTILLTSAEGGLPGIIKMFNWNSVAGPFCLLALLARGRRVRGWLNIFLVASIGLFFLLGTLLRMDRLSSLALMPVILSLIVRRDQRAIRWGAVLVVAALASAAIIETARRGSGQGTLEWLALYLQLGTVNLDLMMKSVTGHTAGLAGVFSFVNWISRGVGIDFLRNPPLFNWSWSDAQNGFGLMYMDFGWLGPLAFLAIGFFAGLIDTKASLPKFRESRWRELQWFACYGLASMAVVPAYSGFDFWFFILASCAYVTLERHMAARAPSFSVGQSQMAG